MCYRTTKLTTHKGEKTLDATKRGQSNTSLNSAKTFINNLFYNYVVSFVYVMIQGKCRKS